jgi:hypothetical protein
MTLITALAAPVYEGMMLPEGARPPHQSLRLEESTTAWVAVMAWTMVMRASWMSYSSWMALTMGARPLVVQDAHETKFSLPSYSSALAPMTTTWESSLAGSEETTFLAPPLMIGGARRAEGGAGGGHRVHDRGEGRGRGQVCGRGEGGGRDPSRDLVKDEARQVIVAKDEDEVGSAAVAKEYEARHVIAAKEEDVAVTWLWRRTRPSS